MGRKRIFVCSFSSGLDDIPKKKRRDPKAVLAVLLKNPRFSCFEVDSALADTLALLGQQEFIRPSEHEDGYPWSRVQVTEAGMAYLQED